MNGYLGGAEGAIGDSSFTSSLAIRTDPFIGGLDMFRGLLLFYAESMGRRM